MPSVFRYRDFPRHFWDAEPDSVLDPGDPEVIRRFLTRGSVEEVATVLDPAVIAARWSELDLPWAAATVWSGVLARLGYQVPGA